MIACLVINNTLKSMMAQKSSTEVQHAPHHTATAGTRG